MLQSCGSAEGEDPADRLPVLWTHDAVHDAPWLEEHGYRRKRTVQKTWPAHDVEQLKDGLRKLGRGADLFCSLQYDPGQWLSHYVMDRKYGPTECKRMAGKLMRLFSVGLTRAPDMVHAADAPHCDEGGGMQGVADGGAGQVGTVDAVDAVHTDVTQGDGLGQSYDSDSDLDCEGNHGGSDSEDEVPLYVPSVA